MKEGRKEGKKEMKELRKEARRDGRKEGWKEERNTLILFYKKQVYKKLVLSSSKN